MQLRHGHAYCLILEWIKIPHKRSKRMNRIYGILGLAALSLTHTLSASAATEYAPGFVWDRSVEWTTEFLVYGETTGNAMPDLLGNPTWSLEWVSGGGFDSPNPWYKQSPNLMIWDNWAPANGRPHDSWVRVDDLEPKITKYGISNSRSLNWGSWDYQAMVRWNNPTDLSFSAVISGRLQLEWGAGSGYMKSPDADVDVIVSKYNSITGVYTSIFEETIKNPEAGKPYPPTTIDIPVHFTDVILRPEDSIIFSLRATTAPSDFDSWVILRDHVTIKMVSVVPEPSSWLAMLLGVPLIGAAIRVRGKNNKNSA